jgi:immunoglobulin-binding protein 1
MCWQLLKEDPRLAEQDEAVTRELWITELKLAVTEAFQGIESINTELQVLALAPPSLRSGGGEEDSRQRRRQKNEYSERLDPPISHLMSPKDGAILDKQGRPLRHFTLLNKRTELQQGVFRPDYNLPTMTIDEYLEENARRGGVIEGGG